MRDDSPISDADAAIILAQAMLGGGEGAIERMEEEGQRRLVLSDTLPIDLGDQREAFEALGFVFGEPVDALFIEALLPEGWKKVATDHSMWSEIVDETGAKRVSIFYKAAPYDRRAHMFLSDKE